MPIRGDIERSGLLLRERRSTSSTQSPYSGAWVVCFTHVYVYAAQNLDFDFEKCCSVSLSPVNVYACLVCGKYFQGRGPRTHAYTHALECTHHMFMKLDNGKVK